MVSAASKSPYSNYQTALKHFWKGDYDEARQAFEQILTSHPEEEVLGDRLRTLIAVCDERLSGDSFRPRTPEDYYLAGIVNINNGRPKEAIESLSKALKKNGENDSVHFSLACAYALYGKEDEALEALARAIELNSDNRVFARNCHEFQPLRESDRFAKLVGL